MMKELRLSKERLQPDVSILINVHNQPLSLKLALRSISAQNYDGLQEVIIADDGSRPELFTQISEEFGDADMPIRYVRQQERGMREPASFNNAIRLARGNYLIFLAGDMVPDLDFVKKHMEAQLKPKLIVAGDRKWRGEITPIIFESLSGKPIEVIINDLEHNWQTDEKSKSREAGERERRKAWLDSQHPWRAAFACNLSTPNKPEVYFDENYKGWGNYDQELAHRLTTKHGYETVYKDDIVAYHLETPESVANIYRTKKHTDIVNYLRNTVYFFDKVQDLDPEEVFFGFARFEFDETIDKWVVVDRPEKITRDRLLEKVNEVRKWLEENNVYPT